MRDEARDMSHSALNQKPREPTNLGTAINARFRPLGGIDLPAVPRDAIRAPPTFDQ